MEKNVFPSIWIGGVVEGNIFTGICRSRESLLSGANLFITLGGNTFVPIAVRIIMVS